jgi:hypothetical protein
MKIIENKNNQIREYIDQAKYLGYYLAAASLKREIGNIYKYYFKNKAKAKENYLAAIEFCDNNTKKGNEQYTETLINICIEMEQYETSYSIFKILTQKQIEYCLKHKSSLISPYREFAKYCIILEKWDEAEKWMKQFKEAWKNENGDYPDEYLLALDFFTKGVKMKDVKLIEKGLLKYHVTKIEDEWIIEHEIDQQIRDKMENFLEQLKAQKTKNR